MTNLRAKIFPLYVGSECEYTGKGQPFKTYGQITKLNFRNIERLINSHERSLLLSPLSSMSRERRIEIIRIHVPGVTGDLTEGVINTVFNEIIERVLLGQPISSEIIDQLREWGYACPAYGFSVHQLVGDGIFKIKE